MSSLSDADSEQGAAAQVPEGKPSATPVASAAPDATAGRKPDWREAELLRRAVRGDRGAYGQVITLYQDRLFNAMLRVVGDPEEARELTQEAFTRALAKIDTFRAESSGYTWLFRIAMNLAITALRKAPIRRTFSLEGHWDQGNGTAEVAGDRRSGRSQDSPADIVEKRERDQAVLDALGRLDPDYRTVLVMRDVEGFDYQQMADVLDIPLGTLKSRLFRARLALRDELEAYIGKRQGQST